MIYKKERLDKILADRNLVDSKSKAQAVIMAGQVYVEGKQIIKSGLNININSLIELKSLGPEWVSRGALKLIKALDEFKIDEIDSKISKYYNALKKTDNSSRLINRTNTFLEEVRCVLDLLEKNNFEKLRIYIKNTKEMWSRSLLNP